MPSERGDTNQMTGMNASFRLGKVLALAGCKMVANGHRIDVQTEDGTVVLQGDIFDIRDRVIFNYHFYGEPIVHPNAWPLFEDSAAEAMRRSMAILSIEKSVVEKNLGMTMLESDDSGLSETDSEAPCLVDVCEGSNADVPVEENQPLNGTVNKGEMPEGNDGLAAKKSEPDDLETEDPVECGLYDPVKQLEHYFATVGIEPKYRFAYNKQDDRCLCILSAGDGVARGKGFGKKQAKAEAADNMIEKLQCGSGPYESKADDVHGPVELLSLSRVPKSGRISQSDVDAWGETDLKPALDSFKARAAGLASVRESGNPHTNTPRRYGLCLKKSERLHLRSTRRKYERKHNKH